METLITQLPALCFPSDLDTVGFGEAASLALAVRVGNTEIFSATLHAEADGHVRLRDFMPLLTDALRAEGNTPQTVTFTYGTAQTESAATLVPCRVMLTEGAEAFTANTFLSLLRGEKLTCLEADEYVSLYSSLASAAQERVYLYGIWLSADGTQRLTSALPTAPIETDDSDRIATFDASPRRLTPPEVGATLISVVARAGNRSQEFRIAPEGLRQASGRPRTVEFRNAFGCRETFHFFGKGEREMKPTWKAAVVRGRYKNYAVEAIPRLTLHTGPMPEAVLPLLDDLLTATEDIAADDGRTLAVVESEVKTSDALSAISEATVTLRETAATRSHRPLRPVRTFDETFDQTFQ